VFFGCRVELMIWFGYGCIVFGCWVYFGDGNWLCVYEGMFMIVDKCVLG